MNKKKAILSLLLLVPAPSIGVLAGMVLWPESTLGKGIFAFSKLWLFALPAVWYLLVEKGNWSLSPARKGGFGFGVLSGLVISGVILAGYFLLGDAFLDRAFMVEKVEEIGLDTPALYIGGAAYWICINSVLEEYVWRWFVVRQCEALMKPMAAVVAAAVFFTLHHTIALSTFMPPTAAIVCSAGIFIGAAVWSWMYVRFESIWPCYVSHAIVDLCIFALGAWMIFT
jgi:membrane protease YdiL (CAAX protease family)